MSSSFILSQTLQSITTTKIHELEKQRNIYEKRKESILSAAEEQGRDQATRVSILLSGIKDLAPTSLIDLQLSNICRWLAQSRYDTSVSGAMLTTFERQLRMKLDHRSRKLELADLYSRLLTDWLNPPARPVGESNIEESFLSSESSLEMVERDRLQQLREKFEAAVFTPLETDEVEIDNYLSELFPEEAGAKALTRLREEVRGFGEHALKDTMPFDERVLRWCIKGLLNNELLSDEKKTILKEFLQDGIVLGEIVDVLNMRWVDIKDWSWDTGDEGMPVEPRRQLNGKYRIMMDEDVLQAIFIHYIGVTWSVSVKATLQTILQHTSVWKHKISVPQAELDRRRYYLGDYKTNKDAHCFGLERQRQETYRNDFFLSQLPSSVHQGAGGYDDDEVEVEEINVKSPKEVRKQLLRQLATEVLVRKALDGEVAVVQSDFQWFATSIPHSTLFAVMRFAGVPEEWIVFFKKFLEAPLNMGPVTEDPSTAGVVRIRKRGVPMAHALEKLFGELVLFFMDFAVNQNAEMLLYRFHDDLWLVGEPEKCAQAWRTMQQFAMVMGLEFNRKKTGSVYITCDGINKDDEIAANLPKGPVSVGFLTLSSATGKWVVDHDQVGAHVKQLQKQLDGFRSILSWVQTWNSCIGRFFGHTFGEPANCFGREHVDAILRTHQQMQQFLFDGTQKNNSSVSKHLKSLITERLGVKSVPDAFLFMPEQFGGLGLRNQFISLFLVRDQLEEDPEKRMQDFLRDEKNRYSEAKKEFEELTTREKRRRMRNIFGDDLSPGSSPIAEPDKFMSMDEYTRSREALSPSLLLAFEYLMRAPSKKDIKLSKEVEDELRKLAAGGQPGLSPSQLDSDTRWIVQMHSVELFDYCGGLSIVDKALLPLGVLKMLRSKKVTWQMVL